MKTVFKFPLPVDDAFHFLPSGKIVLVAWERRDEVTVWVEVTEEEADDIRQHGVRILDRTRDVRVYGTGHPIPGDLEHIGSVRQPEDPTMAIGFLIPLVWHLYSRESE